MKDTTQNKTLLYSVYSIYFFCGLALCFENVFLPEFKTLFNLSYTEQMYTMFAKNIPFIFLSIAIGFLTKKIGYKNCLTIALFLFALGSWLIVPGLTSGNYSVVLAAFFIIGIGFNFEIVAGNPLLSMLGNPEGSSSRLNIGNALGAIAQIVAPLFLTLIIPKSIVTIDEKMPYIQWVFIVTAISLALFGVFTIFMKKEDPANVPPDNKTVLVTKNSLWSNPQVILGFISIFLVIGIEAGLFGLYRNYLEDTTVAGMSSFDSQRMFTIYFAVFALGRLVGSYVQKKVDPSTTLIFNLIISLLLIVLISFSTGWVAVVSVTAIGFFVSIFFPTLYSISIDGLGERTGQASGLLTMGFLGAAIIPILQGKLADTLSLQLSFMIAIFPYVFALFYVLRMMKRSTRI
jgi:MFS transporter, FHS family, L-fucose permease